MNIGHRSGNNKQFLALITSGDIRDPFHTHTRARVERDMRMCACVRVSARVIRGRAITRARPRCAEHS